jgi:L-lactate dehydrogenase (cytochrome)
MGGSKLSGDDVARHNSKDSCWVIVHGKAYDVTEFLPGTTFRYHGMGLY